MLCSVGTYLLRKEVLKSQVIRLVCSVDTVKRSMPKVWVRLVCFVLRLPKSGSCEIVVMISSREFLKQFQGLVTCPLRPSLGTYLCVALFIDTGSGLPFLLTT